MDETAEFSDWEVLPSGGGVSPKGFAAVREGGAYGGIDYDYFKVGKSVVGGEEGTMENPSLVQSEVEGKGEVGYADSSKSEALIVESREVGEIFEEDLRGDGAVGERRGEVSDETDVADGVEVNKETEDKMPITDTGEIRERTFLDDNNRDEDVREKYDLNGTGVIEGSEEFGSAGMECLESADNCNNGEDAVIGGVGLNRTGFVGIGEANKSQGSRVLGSVELEHPEQMIAESSNNGGDDAKEEVGLEATGDRDDELASAESRDVGEWCPEESNPGVVTAGNGEKAAVVWWKAPFELMKFCLFKVRPIWSMSIAAAVVGFILLGRRLYNLRQKRHRLPPKLNVDDKKASQFVSRAARLNEAFSIVKRSPFIKAPFPPAGISPWPVLALR